MGRLILRRIEFTMRDARSGRIPLKFTGMEHGSVAHYRVFVFERPRQHVGDDLHVFVRVAAEALSRGDAVFVHHTQRPEITAI